MYKIGKRIKKIRESKSISQKNFANSIGVKNTTVANWEKGLTRPDVDTLALICEVLNSVQTQAPLTPLTMRFEVCRSTQRYGR